MDFPANKRSGWGKRGLSPSKTKLIIYSGFLASNSADVYKRQVQHIRLIFFLYRNNGLIIYDHLISCLKHIETGTEQLISVYSGFQLVVPLGYLVYENRVACIG